MNFFENFPEFIEEDSRAGRGYSPVTIETLNTRHSASLPVWSVDGNTVLDLGSCLGATGHWVLSNGCSHYTGVEVQPSLAETSKSLLSKYWNSSQFEIVQQDLREFLDKQIANGKKYDVVVMVGVVYAFLDTYGILEKVSKVCDYMLLIDSIYPWHMTGPDVPIIDVINIQHINSSNNNTAFQGSGARPSPAALKIILETFGFVDKEGIINTTPLTDKTIHDVYNIPIERPGSRSYPVPGRFMLRFYNTKKVLTSQVADYVSKNDVKKTVRMAKAPKFEIAESWTFDESVADRFQQEAETHIPDYNRVIDLCLDLTKQVFANKQDISVIDVGSALGHTIDKYIQHGYTNTYGVDNSEAMIKSSKYPDRVILRNNFPVENLYDVILANWTLHFINNRTEYLKDIFNSLNSGGMLVLSDKMDHTIEVENLYYDFKRNNGVPEEVIQQKKLALIGILTTKPLSWYLDTLKSIGFSDIQIVNSRYMFSTIYARKL